MHVNVDFDLGSPAPLVPALVPAFVEWSGGCAPVMQHVGSSTPPCQSAAPRSACSVPSRLYAAPRLEVVLARNGPTLGAAGGFVRACHAVSGTKYFVEIWSGSGSLSRAAACKLYTLEPVEAFPVRAGYRPEFDTDRAVVQHTYERLALDGLLGWVHFGVDCRTLGTLQSFNHGSRSQDNPLGDDSIDREMQSNKQILWMVKLARIVHERGGWVTIENPWASLLWRIESVRALRFKLLKLDQCSHGLTSPAGIVPREYWRKRTGLLCNVDFFGGVATLCDGSHRHTHFWQSQISEPRDPPNAVSLQLPT